MVLRDTGPRIKQVTSAPGRAAVWEQESHKYLSQSNLLAVPHLLEVPEERLLTLLAGVTVQPFWGLKNTLEKKF